MKKIEHDRPLAAGLKSGATPPRLVFPQQEIRRLVSLARAQSGTPLEAAVRDRLLPAFGDLSGVRAHTGPAAEAAARALNAAAYTIGRDLFFGKGVYEPGSGSGEKIIAHESAHAMQQSAAAATGSPALSRNEAAEQDAERSAAGRVRPEYRAPAEQVMTYPKGTTAKQLADEYHDDEDWKKLGAGLYEHAALGTNNYMFVLEVLDLLEIGERKDVVRAFIEKAGDQGLDEIARTELGRIFLRNLQRVFGVGLSFRSELTEMVKIDDAIGRGEGQSRAESVLDEAARRVEAAPPEAVPPVPAAMVDPAEITGRLRLLRTVLARLNDQYATDSQVGPAIAKVESDLNERFEDASGDIDIKDDVTEEDAGIVAAAQSIVEESSRRLAELDKKLAPDPFTAAVQKLLGATGFAAAIPLMQDPLFMHLLALGGKVRAAWVEALAAAATTAGPKRLAVAQAESAALPEALTELALSIPAQHQGHAPALELTTKSMHEWVEWVRGKLQALRSDAVALAKARESGAPDVSAHEAKIRDTGEIISLSIEGIQLWDHALRATQEFYAGTNLVSNLLPHTPFVYRDAGRIRDRCQVMKNLALAGDLVNLRKEAERNRTDPNIKQFFEAMPGFIQGGNLVVSVVANLLLNFGVFKIASMAGAAAGALVSSGEGASLANVAAQIGIEALTFTGVSRTLYAAAGRSSKTSFLLEFALNTAMFGVLRFTGFAIESALAARGMEVYAGAVTHVVSFPLLQVFGTLQFRIEEGRLPSRDEIADMAANNVLLYAAMMRAPAPEGKTGAHSPFTVLEKLHGKHNGSIEAFENARARLASHIAEEIKAEHGDDPAVQNRLETEARNLEENAKGLVDEVKKDPEIKIDTLKRELEDPSLQTPEASGQLLTRSFDLPPETGLRHAGGEAQYSYEFGTTEDVVRALEAKHAAVTESIDNNGLHTVTAEVEDGRTMYFAERAEAVPEASRPKRKIIVAPAPKPAPSPKPAPKPRARAKGELFDEDGKLTSQGVTQVKRATRNKNLTADEAEMQLRGNPRVLEHVVKEHFRRAAARGEVPGRVVVRNNVRGYAKDLPQTGNLNLDQGVITFLNRAENSGLRSALHERLRTLRKELKVPEADLTDTMIETDPWRAAARLQQKAAATLPEGDGLRKAANEFVDSLSRILGDLKPDMIVWDPAGPKLMVVDPTHTVGTKFAIYHEFKTLLYARVFEVMTGLPVTAIDFRSPKESRLLTP
jgi:Domain of unknown function (DUF4157)